MTDATHEQDPFFEMAPLYAVGALTPEEQTIFEAHLNQPCPACRAEVRSFDGVTAGLAGLSETEPPEHLKERLLEHIVASPHRPGILHADQGLLIARSAEMAWQPMAPGIEFKPLFHDRQRSHTSLLVRMNAGAKYSNHRHAGVEELYVLAGELNVAGHVMRAGDYCRAEVGSEHGVTFSDTGCMILLITPTNNEMLA